MGNKIIAYFDVMGFRDLVYRKSHEEVGKLMDKLCDTANALGGLEKKYNILKYDMPPKALQHGEISVVAFSDTVLFISKSDTVDEVRKILFYATYLLKKMLFDGVPIKGAIAHGEFTAEYTFNKFYGKPLIDCYDLADQVNFYGVVFHDTFEKLFNKYGLNGEIKTSVDEQLKSSVGEEKIPMKGGNITHKYITLQEDNLNELVAGFYESVSGNTRIYVDNTWYVYVDKCNKSS